MVVNSPSIVFFHALKKKKMDRLGVRKDWTKNNGNTKMDIDGLNNDRVP